MGYFRPLIMSVFKNEKNSEKKIKLLNHIERFIFITFRLSQARSNYRDSEFYNASREFNQGELTLEEIKQKLDNAAAYCFHEDGMLNSKYFYDYLYSDSIALAKVVITAGMAYAISYTNMNLICYLKVGRKR